MDRIALHVNRLLFDPFKCPDRPLTLLPLYLVRHRRKPPKLRYLPPSDNAGTGSRGSYAIIKGDISTLYKDMSYLKSCKLTSPSIFVLLLLSPLSLSLSPFLGHSLCLL